MRSSRFAALIGLLAVAAPLSGQAFTNGSLTGPINNGGVPTGWTLEAGSPDTMDENNNVGVPGALGFGAAPSPSPDGGTWVGVGGEGATGFVERFSQSVSGFTVGQTYTVNFYASNFGAADFGYVATNFFEMLIDGVAMDSGADLPLAPGWTLQTLSFLATSATHTIAFQLGDGAKSYMGIDGISIAGGMSTVPEPATTALLGAGLLALGGIVSRRRRAMAA
ncbi:MAG: PEP-CTERM sorting domain-containing protein [Gemmatimonadaceae bacterium]|nr:PEP-CTERM sorting domain-containing protein [Gemmatimonadaceae bacterium]